jgi:hypothetical protein
LSKWVVDVVGVQRVGCRLQRVVVQRELSSKGVVDAVGAQRVDRRRLLACIAVQGDNVASTTLNTGGQPMLGGEGKEGWRGEGVFILNFCQA